MKICSGCQTKNRDDAIFCTKCGKKFKKEADLQKVVLLVGVFLVLFSSIFFGILNWKNMIDLYRLLFFVFETCLFFLMSLALKKTSNSVSRIFFVIGFVLTPFTLSMIPYYNLVPSILYNNALIYLYLAIIYFLTAVAYKLINIKFKGKILDYLALLSLLLTVIFTTLIFTSDIVIIGLIVTLYMIVLTIISKTKLVGEDKSYYNCSVILSFLITIFLLICFFQRETQDFIINGITLALFMGDTYFKIYGKEKTILYFFAPFMLQSLTFIYLVNLFDDNDTISMLSIAAVNIALYFVTLLFKNKMFSITTLVLSYIMLGFLSFVCLVLPEMKILTILSILFLSFNLAVLVIKKYNFVHFLITLNVLLFVVGLNSWLYNFGSLIIIGFLLIIYLIIYLVLNLINNKYDFIYLIIMLAIGFVGTFIMGNETEFSIMQLIVAIIFAIGYILVNILREHASIRIIWFIILNMIILALFSNIYYAVLAITIFTIITCTLLQKVTKFNFKPQLLYAEILVFIVTLCNTMEFNVYSLYINVLAFILGYLSLINFHNKKPWKIAYIMVGLLYITKLLGTIIEPVVICSLISILINLIVLTSMYLLDRFNSKELVVISLVTLIPYYTLISAGLNSSIYELYLAPLVVYHVILLFVIKWKSISNRNVFILIPFFVIAALFIISNSGVVSTIIDAIFVLTYIIVGLVKKYNLLIYFSIGILVLTILLQLFTVLNNMSVIIALLVVGFILIFVAVIYGTKKKD